MEWTDAHVHIGDDAGGASGDLDEIDAFMVDGTIDRAVVFCMDERDGIPAGNDRVRETVAGRDDLAGLFRIDPSVHDPADLRDREAFAGYKMHPRAQDFGMQEVYRHLEAIADEGKPVIIHTGVGDGSRMHPEDILETASVHRDVDIVLAHNAKGYVFHADGFREALGDLDNAYMDISLHCTPFGVEMLVDDLGADHVLFASDYPYGHPAPMRQNVELADITEDEREMVAGGTADRLFF
ncbi:MAG: amidohydrolase family protein [Candidatus Nanohaloarchaea archaeon]